MRRLFGAVTRGVSVAIVVVTLSAPAVYAVPRERDVEPVRERIVRVIRHLISIVMGDELVEPKPTQPTP